MRHKLALATAIGLLLVIAIPWQLSGVVAPIRWVESGAALVGIGMLWWRPRIGCIIGEVIYLSGVVDIIVFDWPARTINNIPAAIGLGVWSIASVIALEWAGRELEAERHVR